MNKNNDNQTDQRLDLEELDVRALEERLELAPATGWDCCGRCEPPPPPPPP